MAILQHLALTGNDRNVLIATTLPVGRASTVTVWVFLHCFVSLLLGRDGFGAFTTSVFASFSASLPGLFLLVLPNLDFYLPQDGIGSIYQLVKFAFQFCIAKDSFYWYRQIVRPHWYFHVCLTKFDGDRIGSESNLFDQIS